MLNIGSKHCKYKCIAHKKYFQIEATAQIQSYTNRIYRITHMQTATLWLSMHQCSNTNGSNYDAASDN